MYYVLCRSRRYGILVGGTSVPKFRYLYLLPDRQGTDATSSDGGSPSVVLVLVGTEYINNHKVSTRIKYMSPVYKVRSFS